MSGAAAPVDARPRVRVVYYLDPITGYTTQKRAPFSPTGGQIIMPTDDGVTWQDGDEYAFVPYHRVLMVRDEPVDDGTVAF